MKKWKKNLVAFAILLTVCGGIYANWHYTENQAVADLTDTLDSDKILSSDMLVMADGEDVLAVTLGSVGRKTVGYVLKVFTPFAIISQIVIQITFFATVELQVHLIVSF